MVVVMVVVTVVASTATREGATARVVGSVVARKLTTEAWMGLAAARAAAAQWAAVDWEVVTSQRKSHHPWWRWNHSWCR